MGRCTRETDEQHSRTIVCEKVSQAPPGFPVSFRDINPEELFLTFNYGDTIHFSSDRRQQLVDLTADPKNDAYYKHACLISILGLSHLYFGFAVLIEAALG
jgi:hypothetical protein